SEPTASNGKAPANAWSRPLQPKRAAGPPPGMGPPSASNMESAPSSMMIQNRERFLHLSLTLIGQKVVLEQTDGSILEGIFHTFTPFNILPAENRNKYVLKEIRVQRKPISNNGGPDSTIENGATLVVPASRVVYLHAKNIDLERPDRAAAPNSMNGVGGSNSLVTASEEAFVTDTQISGAKGGKGRDLVAAGSAWTDLGDSNANGGGGSYRNQALNAPLQTNSRAAAFGGPRSNKDKGSEAANPTGKLAGSIGEWDQFKANEELFNVNASFDENLYTTQLDKGAIDAKKIAQAERIAREIETSTTKNAHLAEERGQKIENDFRDEEDKYSGVLTDDMKQRHEAKAKSEREAKVKASNKTASSSESSTTASSAGPKKIMNYAAAAAKADASKKALPPGLSTSAPTTSGPKVSKDDSAKGIAASVVAPDAKDKGKSAGNERGGSKIEPKKSDQKGKAPKAADSTTKPKREEKKTPNESSRSAIDKPAESKESKGDDQKKEAATSSKLNANAKSFTFNPSAKSFTPSFSAGAAQQTPQPSVPTDPNMAMYGGGHSMQPPHYIQAPPMGQPGMMHMMNPQYAAGMRYPPQPVAQMQPPQGQQMQGAGPSVPPSSGGNPAAPPGGPPAVSSEDDPTPSQEGDSSQPAGSGQHQKSQQPTADQQGQPGQQQMPMHYGVPQGAYFPGGAMAMPPRGPGYPPQFVAGPQQIPGRPTPYGMFPLQPGGMPPNMAMRGPNGAPYYPGPNGPLPYPPGAYMGHGMMEDGNNDPNYRGRGRGPGRGRGSGRGRGRGGGGGRGRGYNNNHHQSSGGNNSGRNTPQQQASSQQQQGPPPPAGPPPTDGDASTGEVAAPKNANGGE
ncbi:MAG: hypothetical protein SGILL_000637, partial [Bacillariaceae sp.]